MSTKKINISRERSEYFYSRYCRGESISRILREEKHETVSCHVITKSWRKYGFIYTPTKDYFENIDSEEKAYYLGFIAADGCIIHQDSRSSILNISIQERDGYILEPLRLSISPYKPLVLYEMRQKGWSRRITFRVAQSKLVSDLAKYGIVENKTYKELFIPNIPDHLKPHFVRGFFDGDGCCYLQLTNHSKHTKTGNFKNRISIVCLTSGILNAIKELTGLGKVSRRRKKGHRQDIFVYDIERKEEVSRFYNYIYQNATIFLKRKKDKFLQGNPVLTTNLITSNSVETRN